MTRIVLVPIEEHRDPSWAIRHVAALHRAGDVRIHLLNVRNPLPVYVARFIAREQLQAFYQESGAQALRPAVEQLDALGVPHRDHVRVGRKAETIAEFARDLQCTQIVVPSPARGFIPEFGLGSVASQLRHLIGASGCDISEVH